MPISYEVRGRVTDRQDLVVGLAVLLAVLGVWCGVTYTGLVRPMFFPSPSGIWEGLVHLHSKGWLLAAMLRSSVRVTIALLAVVAIGVPIGVLMGAFAPIDAGLRKLFNGAKSVPVTGLVALVVLWFGIDEMGKIAYLFMGAFFYIAILTKNAVRSVSEDYLRVARDIVLTRRQTVMRVLVPGALPQIWDAIGVCNGIMWTYIVLAEFVCSNEQQLGLGYLLKMGSQLQQSGQVFGVLIIIAGISSLTDFLLHLVRRRYFNW